MKELNYILGYVIFFISITLGNCLGYYKRRQEEPEDIRISIDNTNKYISKR